MNDQPDYTEYTTAELSEALRTIDRDRYSQRAERLDLLIRDRARRETLQAAAEAPSTSPAAPSVATKPRTSGLPILLGVVIGLAALGLVGLWAIGAMVQKTGWFGGADKVFGDQHLKTVVALVELHNTRNGEYPATLRELDFIGQWDQIHIQSVSYCAAEDRASYFVEVVRGVIGKPNLEPEDEFWHGTGYDPAVGPCD